MDQKTESAKTHGRLAWIISAWYLFVLWSWSGSLQARNEELFAVSVVIMLSGVVLTVISFGGFLYGLRKSAQQPGQLDNDFIVRVLIDLGALTVFSRFSVMMNRISEGFDEDAVLLLVAGVIVLTLAYGVVRVVIGISPVRGYFAARWRAVAVLLLGLAIIGAWHDVMHGLRLLLAGMGVESAANDIHGNTALNALWYGGYAFALALLAVFLLMLAASFRQFAMIWSDVAGVAIKTKASFKPRPVKKTRAGERALNAGAPAPVRQTRAAAKRR